MTNKAPRDIRAVFKEHEEEDFQWFCYNPNCSDIADEIKELLKAYDTLQAELDEAQKEIESLAYSWQDCLNRLERAESLLREVYERDYYYEIGETVASKIDEYFNEVKGE